MSNTFLVLEGEGRKCRWRLQIQNRGENSLNNGTILRLSPRSPQASGRDVAAVQSLQWAGGALAAAFLSFIVPCELHHIVLLLLLLFR